MRAKNILHLGVKELWSLARDPMMLVLIVYAFTASIYSTASALPDSLHNAPIAIVDEDQSPLSQRIVNAFQPPLFVPPKLVSREEMDARMDAGLDTFALNIPPNFQQDVLAGRSPAIQLNTDATRVGQAFSGSGYVQTIVQGEVQTWLQRYRTSFTTAGGHRGAGALQPQPDPVPVRRRGGADRHDHHAVGPAHRFRPDPRARARHGRAPAGDAGDAVRDHDEQGLVDGAGGARHLRRLHGRSSCRAVLAVPIQGSVALFLCGAALHLFAATSLGMFLATFARTMPQFALLMIMVLLPLQMLSGGMTPRESMPEWVQQIMLAAPTTHFVMLAQGILFRGAGLEAVWPQFLALAVIGAVLFGVALARFRKTIGSM